MRAWSNLSISKKLSSVVGIMAVLILGELAALHFATRTLSAVRAFVAGEGTWSKAQKNAVLSLQRYGVTRNERDYQAFLENLVVTEGDRKARIELSQTDPDREVIRAGLLRGRIHPDDIDPMIDLILRFNRVSYIEKALAAWTRADELLDELKSVAELYRARLSHPSPPKAELQDLEQRIRVLDAALTEEETHFSQVLGEGSRWLEKAIFMLLLGAVLTVECFGLTLAFMTGRTISRGLIEVQKAAERVGQGDFSQRVEVRSQDEIGSLARSINQMSESLEMKVRERTAELERLSQEARAAVQARDEFLSIASHELRTPVTALLLQIELLGRSLAPPNGPGLDLERSLALAQKCQRQISRMRALLDELLDLTRLRTGRLTLQLERLDLALLVREVAQEFSAEAARQGSQIDVATEVVEASVDPVRIRQVVSNLISNAIKYGASRPISIRLKRAEDGGSVLTVEDQGLGIAPEEQSRIFGRFERAPGTEAITGLGLGLYVSKQIVEAHGGSISVESRPTRGSTFRVLLPA